MSDCSKYCVVQDLYNDVIDKYKIKVVMLDLDGVVYRGPRAISGVPDCINDLVRRGVRVLYVTNNASRSGAFFRRKLTALGVDNSLMLSQDALAPVVYTSGTAAALLLLRRSSSFNQKYGNPVRKHLDVYAIVEDGFAEEFDATFSQLKRSQPSELVYESATVHGISKDNSKTLDVQSGVDPVVADESVSVVVIGFDAFINYYKLAYATSCLYRNHGPDGVSRCPLVVCNTDPVLPLSIRLSPDAPLQSVKMPGAGSLVAALLTASGRNLDDDDTFLCGKPNARVLWPAVEASERTVDPSLKSDEVLMVGDTMKTDIQFGVDCGVRTMLVLSGNTTSIEQARSISTDFAPDFVAGSFIVHKN